MKKLLVSIVLALSLMFAISVLGAEGTKQYCNKTLETCFTMPEMAPEFLTWPGQVMAREAGPNGAQLVVIETVNDQAAPEILVYSLWYVNPERKILPIAFAVYYSQTPNVAPECYEDVGFMSTGTPSGVFARVKEATELDVIRTLAYKGRII